MRVLLTINFVEDWAVVMELDVSSLDEIMDEVRQHPERWTSFEAIIVNNEG